MFGSSGQIREGHWVCSAVGAELEREDIIPLYQRLYSAEAPEFISGDVFCRRGFGCGSEAQDYSGLCLKVS